MIKEASENRYLVPADTPLVIPHQSEFSLSSLALDALDTEDFSALRAFSLLHNSTEIGILTPHVMKGTYSNVITYFDLNLHREDSPTLTTPTPPMRATIPFSFGFNRHENREYISQPVKILEDPNTRRFHRWARVGERPRHETGSNVLKLNSRGGLLTLPVTNPLTLEISQLKGAKFRLDFSRNTQNK